MRPPKEWVEEVASRPYDVLNSEEARKEAEGNENRYTISSGRRLIFLKVRTSMTLAYTKSGRKLPEVPRKRLAGTRRETLLLRLCPNNERKDPIWTGGGCLCARLYERKHQKHELTRRDKEEDRMKHVRVNNANIEPVFFAYPENAELDAIVQKYVSRKPEYDFIAPGDGFGHTFWVIDANEDIDAITHAFEKCRLCISQTDTTGVRRRHW